VGWVNYLLVWGVFHQLGFAWQDGTFRQWWRPAGLAVISMGALVALVWWGPYPVSMVGVPGARIQNASPPSAALLAFGLAQSGVLLAVEPAVRRWLDERSRARSAITTAGAFTMPIYLWHMAPVVLVAVAGYPDHLVSQPRIGSGAWWLQRIIWVVALAIVLALVLTVISLATRLGRDRHKAAVPSSIHVNSGLLLAGAATAAYGTGRLAVDGFAPAGRLGPVPLVALAIGTLLVIGSAQVGYRTKPRASR
jgi:hypothetical protein